MRSLRAISRSMSNDNLEYRRLGGYSATFHSFFPLLEAMLPKAEAFKKKINGPNKAFNDLLRFTVDADLEPWLFLCATQVCTSCKNKLSRILLSASAHHPS